MQFNNQLCDRYTCEALPSKAPATRKSNEYSLKSIRKAFAGNRVAAILPMHIYQYRDAIGKRESQKKANLDLEVLSHVFTNAIEWGVIKAPHPMTNKNVVKYSLKGRDRYVENWELRAWASVANPFLVAYIVLKGTTGLRQQDLLTIKIRDISETELVSVSLKTGKSLRFPLVDDEGNPTTVHLALEVVKKHYAEFNAKRRVPVMSPWLFRTRKGTGYWNEEKENADSFSSVWQRSMKKALEQTDLEERFTEHDLRAKVGSDVDSVEEAQRLLAHANAATTEKHYRRKGAKIVPAAGFRMDE
jgi:integrase